MADSASDSKKTDPTDLASLLDIKVLGADLFRSSYVRLPRGERGVFGGQIIAQAIMAATHTVDRSFHLHVSAPLYIMVQALNKPRIKSLHCYFLLSGLPTPIDYNVDHIRNGRSYSTRVVRAIQNGKTIFIMVCSYQKPEHWQPTYRSPMPKVPDPEECDTIQVYFRKRGEEQTDEWTKRRYLARAKFHERGNPIEVRYASDGFQDGYYVLCMWMRATHLPECDAAHQKAVLGYISDLLFLEAGGGALGLRESNEEGADVSAFATTIDHSIWYYSDDFDCSEWLLLESRVPQAGSGRAIVHRRAFTRDGTLIANFSQEGAVRARVYGPEEPEKVESKL